MDLDKFTVSVSGNALSVMAVAIIVVVAARSGLVNPRTQSFSHNETVS
jgi:hypothetical protein